MSIYHADKWEVWGYPADETWDRKTYDIGYVTDSGAGGWVAQVLTKEDAEFIIRAVKTHIAVGRATDAREQQ